MAPSLPREGLMRNAAVRLSVDDDGRVTTVAVVGRPKPHPFGPYEGSHVTPWAVFADTVRRAIAGTRTSTAARRLRELITELDYEDETEANRLPTDRAKLFNAAADEAWEALNEFNDKRDLKDLERAIACYLTARNLAPLAAVFLGPDKAKGRGEATLLSKLRAYEEGTADCDETELADALAGLLDKATIAHILTTTDANTAPGVSNLRLNSARSAVVQHLTEVSRAYPLAYDSSGLADPETFDSYFPDVAAGDYELPTVEYDWPDAPEGWSASSGQVCLVNVTMKRGKSGLYIATVEFTGRGNTLLNTQGHHLTAHVAVEAAVRRTVVKQKPINALTRLLGLANEITMLATWPRTALPTAEARNIFKAALATFNAASESAKETANDPSAHDVDLVAEIESLAGAYVMMRNAMPMAAILRGATSDGKGEARAMRMLHEWDAKKRTFNPDQACWIFWRLLDTTAMDDLATDDMRIQDDAPGAPADPDERVARVLSVHLATIEAAFPDLAGKSAVRSVDSVTWVLNQKARPFPKAYIKSLDLRDDDDDSVQPVCPYVTKKAARDDDDEYMPDEKPTRRPRKTRKK